MNKTRSFGMPYTGSKNRYAKDICRVLPAGNRLVDLFGGGGAITDCALSLYADKWKSVYYNDIDKEIADLFKKCCDGYYTSPEFDYNGFWTSREEFKTTTDYAKLLCFSFGNRTKRRTYFCRVSDEETKKEMYMEGMRKKLQGGRRLIRCDPITRLARLQRLGKYKDDARLEIHNHSYEEYEYKTGDIVYCDIPYRDTDMYVSDSFDLEKFFAWANAQPYDVYFSSYLPGLPVWAKETFSIFGGGSRTSRIEGLMKL